MTEKKNTSSSKTLNDIPSDVVNQCFEKNEGKIADLGEEWNPYDDIVDKNLPSVRLVLAEKISSHEWHILFERGGFVRRFIQCEVEFKDNKWILKKKEILAKPHRS